jgi:hypothetical protein
MYDINGYLRLPNPSATVWAPRICAWDGENPNAVRHDDVLAFANDSEACLFQRLHRFAMRDTRNPD